MFVHIKRASIILHLLLNIQVSDTFSQYVSLSRKPKDLSSCDYKNHIALVEHFFNIIFAEFHNTPPVCVCVQMCRHQSTYCYPTSCMKTSDNRKKYETNQLVIPLPRAELNDTTKPVFAFENGEEKTGNYITDFIDNVGMKKVISEPSDEIIKSEVHKSNPLKDRYKMVFKYKRLPKVEMRYNLREQVKNMKSDKVKVENNDMSSQRWPKGKHWIHSRQLIEPTQQLKIDEAKAKKFYMFTENDPSTDNSPKYFKRDASKITPNDDEINVETLYIYQTDSTMESSNNSVESMIDNLIESSFEGLTNLVGMEANNTLNQSADDKPSVDSFVYRAKNAIENNSTNTVAYNESSKDFKSTTVDETTTQSDSVEDPNIILQSKANFLDIIAKMSNKIEQQNNASIEIINRIAGHNNLKHFESKPTHVHESKDNITNEVNMEIKESTESSKSKRDITIINISFYPLIHDIKTENDRNK